jgi:RNA polymerase sigma-70 factor (ECF subfamily)
MARKETLEDNPIDRIQQQEKVKAFWHCLQGLSSEHREVLELAFMQGIPQEEISKIIDCPIGTVKSRVHYAKQQLRLCLQQLGRLEET